MRGFVKTFFITIGLISMAAISCNKVEDNTTDPGLVKHTCEMRLVGSLMDFDSPDTKAAANGTNWKDGSVIYLRMDSPLGITTGEAIYSSSKDTWTVSYYGSLQEGVSKSCSAFYVEDEISYESSVFTMDEKTVIYEDVTGSYIYDQGDLVVTANLKPKTGRIRFSGEPGKVLKIYGVTHYATYDINNNQYTTSSEPFKITVGSDGSTPYFYGYFLDTTERNINVWIDAKEAYTRYFSDSVFNPGQSGVLSVPKEVNHNGWAEGLYFCINSIRFKLVAVEGGTFMMGEPESTYEYLIPHNVTLTGYCIAEAEMTKQLYYKTLELNSTDQSPCLCDWEYDLPNALNYLNQKTFAGFTIPTEAQWEYAAKGGKKSKGYTYSGSNIIDDVAWYNMNSQEKLNDIKKKLPNELGLYDMSGNAHEFVLDYYNAYSAASVTDPISLKGSSGHVIRGGHYDVEAEKCTNIARVSNYKYYYSGGWLADQVDCTIRLALNWN